MQTRSLLRNILHIKHGMCLLKRKIAGGPRGSGGSPNARNTNICCGLFGTGFHSSDSSQYFEICGSTFANIFGGGGGVGTGYLHCLWMPLMLLKGGGGGVICNTYMFRGSRGSVVGVATVLWAGRPGVRIEHFPKRPDRLWGPASLLFSGCRRASFPG